MINEDQVDSRIVNAVRQLKTKNETPTTGSNPSTIDSFPVLKKNPTGQKLTASILKQKIKIITPKVSATKLIINDQPEVHQSQLPPQSQPQPHPQPHAQHPQNQSQDQNDDNKLSKIDYSKKRSLNQLSTSKRARSKSMLNKKQKVATHSLIIESILKKDTTNWINLSKTDAELKELWNEARIDMSIEKFVNDNFYSNPTFLYKIEILTLEDLIESSKLPVFSVRKSNVSLKALKDNLFKSEMRRRLEIKKVDNNYKTKFDALKGKIDLHMNQLLKYNI